MGVTDTSTRMVVVIYMVMVTVTLMATGIRLILDDVTFTVTKDTPFRVQIWLFVITTQVCGKCCPENAQKMRETQMLDVLLPRINLTMVIGVASLPGTRKICAAKAGKK